MIISLVFIGLLCLWGIRFSGNHEEYCAPGPTTAIKGVLILLVFCSHSIGYLSPPETFESQIYQRVLYFIGQSMVAPFFFYSGFGISESVKNKPGYRRTFLKRRFLKTLLHFDIAVLLFVIVSFILRTPYTLKEYLLCWTGWESVGNSNWFIFVILALYLAIFAAMSIPRGSLFVKTLIPAVLLWIILYLTHPDKPWWYDTILAFPLGILFSETKPKIDKLLHKPVFWTAVFILLFCAYPGMHYLIGVDPWGIVSCLFCLLIVVLTMKVHIGNPVLQWLGKNVFPLYILQRLPMLVLAHFGLNQNIALFMVLSLIFTLLLAWGFSACMNIIDKKLFARG